MRVTTYSANDYANAQRALLPPGAAFDWPQGGFGDALLQGMGGELARVGDGVQVLLDNAITQHSPKYGNWNISEYRRVAAEAVAGVSGSVPVEQLRIDHLFRPFRVGSHVGDRLWSSRSRYVMRVRYDSSVIDPQPVWDALYAFKQAHVFLWFEDMTGVGGHYGQN